MRSMRVSSLHFYFRFFFLMIPRPPISTLFPYTTLFRSWRTSCRSPQPLRPLLSLQRPQRPRSEEHTSELQSRGHLVCRLLLEKKKTLQRLDKFLTTINIHPIQLSFTILSACRPIPVSST